MDGDIDTTLQYESTWHKLNTVLQNIISKFHPVRDYDLIPAINLLEYQVAVYGIYIERYMNAEWKLTRENIDVEEQTVKSIMEFFYKWCEAEVLAKYNSNIENKTIESRYIAEQTHHNMNVLCKGYIEYARYIVKSSTANEYIPALHSSQSSIENHFSCVRGIGKDRTDLYGTAVVQLNVRSNMKGTVAMIQVLLLPVKKSMLLMCLISKWLIKKLLNKPIQLI